MQRSLWWSMRNDDCADVSSHLLHTSVHTSPTPPRSLCLIHHPPTYPTTGFNSAPSILPVTLTTWVWYYFWIKDNLVQQLPHFPYWKMSLNSNLMRSEVFWIHQFKHLGATILCGAWSPMKSETFLVEPETIRVWEFWVWTLEPDCLSLKPLHHLPCDFR